jgi:hypothetical protein
MTYLEQAVWALESGLLAANRIEGRPQQQIAPQASDFSRRHHHAWSGAGISWGGI